MAQNVTAAEASTEVSLHLYLLGHFRLESAQGPIQLPTRKVEALLAYLVLHPEIHAREKLAALLWGDYPDAQARASLRNALAVLRKRLGDELLLTNRETTQINPTYPLWVDSLEFRRQATPFLAAALPDPAGIKLELYEGDLLTDFYDDWILSEREEYRRLYLEILLRLTEAMRTRGEYHRAIDLAERLLAHDPAHESAYQTLMVCHLALGDRHAALRWATAGEAVDVAAGLRLGGALWRFWDLRGYITEGRERLLQLLVLPSASARTETRAKAVFSAGMLALYQTDSLTAAALLEESLEVWRALGHPYGLALTLQHLGFVAHRLGQHQVARARYEESLTQWREIEGYWGLAETLGLLGNLAYWQGDYTAAQALQKESLQIKRQLGERRGLAFSVWSLGKVAQAQGDYATARSLYTEAIVMMRQLADKGGIPFLIDHYAPPGVPPGREGWKQTRLIFLAGFPDGRWEEEDLIAVDDKVVGRFVFRGTHQGDFFGIPATGKQVVVTNIHIMRFVGGKIVEHWGNGDDLGLLQQLGAVPMPA